MHFSNSIALLGMSIFFTTSSAMPFDLNTTLMAREAASECTIKYELTEFLPRPAGGRQSVIKASLLDGYDPTTPLMNPTIQDLKWLGKDGSPVAEVSMDNAVELNEHGVFIHGIKGNNNMMIMWQKSPDNPEGSEWLDFYYGPPDAGLLRWKDLDEDVGYAGCPSKGIWWYKRDGTSRTRTTHCWWTC
ncbi:hypothetical protein FB567DRAFT_175091 [Paraphoma chrysanthemicola]|uniref:Uncharacterized protein n=1 Tax=Paraphoma chrysanthemicola TaxID=798071 RepID=A0A8K0RDD2_9PLEO|nr:hypothetical protein FB567DRAFT_175091 [Paraphoma chrysanthemicola]